MVDGIFLLMTKTRKMSSNPPRRRRVLNPAFAAAHRLASSSPLPVSQSTILEQCINQARRTGKLKAVDMNLRDWDSILVWPTVAVNYSMDDESATWNQHHPETISILDVSDNPLDWEDRICTSCPSLICFRAKQCHFTNIQMRFLQSLVTLDLSGNRLTTLNLENIPKSIQDLDVSSNLLKSVSPIPIDLPHLVSFNVCNNKLDSIPILHSPLLRTMSCASNELKALDFVLAAQNLNSLEASRNRISKLDLLPNSLQTLDLSHNRISSIDVKLPESLVLLIMSQNRIRSVNLMGCYNLKEVLLNDNDFSQPPEGLDSLKSVQTLDLRNNHLDDLPYTVGFLPDLQRLKLDGNPMRRLRNAADGDILQLLRKRAPISDDLRNPSHSAQKSTRNGKTVLSLENQQRNEWHPLDTDDCVEHLNLVGNELTSIDWLHMLPNLKVLEATKNKILSIPSLRTTYLTDLHLRGNRVESLTDLPPTLKTLDVSWNRITHFSTTLPNTLRHLNLAGNRMETFHASPMPRDLEYVDISDNKISDLKDLPLNLAAHCPRVRVLLLSNNELCRIPLELGLVESLNTLELKGNPQRAIRYQIIEKPCSAILSYLKDRMTPSQLEQAISEIESRRQESKNMQSSKPVMHPVELIDEATHVPETMESSQEIEPVTAMRSAPEVAVKFEVPTSEAGNSDSTSSYLLELRASIDIIAAELQNNFSLTQAKRYALKKELALARSKLIREERRIQQSS
jgi:Leucine-rich repeat (LRR) protein